ncbi:MAG TPA: DUF1559 domain-containing protein [Gemmataceae bacterium]|nr:DUF1559 domain-containing protein [Gemmataceae bacterium]
MRTLTLLLLALFPAGCSKSRQSSDRNTAEAAKRLKHIGLAMHAYNATAGAFPAGLYTTDNRVGLSWRVQILPYVEQAALFQQFKLDEPWDSAHNKQLIPMMPAVFATPGVDVPTGHTFVRGFATPEGSPVAFFPGPLELKSTLARQPGTPVPGRRITTVTDGTSNSIMLAEAAEAVPWTKPEALECHPSNPLSLLGPVRGGFLALMGDGAVRLFPEGLSHASLRLAITINDGNPLPAEINAPVWNAR